MRRRCRTSRASATGMRTRTFNSTMNGRGETRFGPADQRERQQDDRPRVADRRVRQLPLSHHPRGRVVPQLVAALVVEPAVVPHGERDGERREPLSDDERRQDVRGRAYWPFEPREQPWRGAEPDACDRSSRGDRERRAVPLDRAREPVAKRRVRVEAEELLRARDVEAPSRLPVRHRGVPDDLALEAGQLGDRARRGRGWRSPRSCRG